MKKTVEELKYRVETCNQPIGETGDYDSWVELVTPDFNLQCYDPNVEIEQIEELVTMLNEHGLIKPELTRLQKENEELLAKIAQIKATLPDNKIRDLNPIWVRDEIVKLLTK